VKKTRSISATIAPRVRHADRAPCGPSTSDRTLLQFLLVTLTGRPSCHQDRQFPLLSPPRFHRIPRIQRMLRLLQALRLQLRMPPRPRFPPRRPEHAVITSSVAIGTSIPAREATPIVTINRTIITTIKADTPAFGERGAFKFCPGASQRSQTRAVARRLVPK